MILTVVAVSLLGAVNPVQLAAPGFGVVNLPEDRGSFFAEHLAQQLTGPAVTVVTSRQIASLLGQERQRQLLGCGGESASCIAELANALGTDGVIVGSVGKIGAVFQVNVTIISGTDGKPLASLSSTESTEEGVLDALTRGAPGLAAEVFARLRPGHKLVPASGGLRRIALVPAVIGVVVAALGVGLTLSAWGDSDRLRGTGGSATEHLSLADAQQLSSTGATKQTLGFLLAGVGLAALVAAGAMALFGSESPAHITLAVTPTGGALVFGAGF